MTKQTSLIAYREMKPSIGRRQKEVLNALQVIGPCDNKMISQYLGQPINQITPRVYELRQLGKVEEAYVGQCPITGREVTYWKAV